MALFIQNINRHIVAALALTVATVPQSGYATTIYAQNFNDQAAFRGPQWPGYESYNHSSSDRYADAAYVQIKPADGWSFSGDTAYVVDNVSGDGALLLNEYRGQAYASRTLTGLTPGTTYYLSFLLYGDNVPGSPWELNFGTNGTYSNYLTGHDVGAALNAGTTIYSSFTAAGPSTSLDFTETTLSGASPIIDDIVVSDTKPANFQTTPSGPIGSGPLPSPVPPSPVPEPASWMLFTVGLGILGAVLRKSHHASPRLAQV